MIRISVNNYEEPKIEIKGGSVLLLKDKTNNSFVIAIIVKTIICSI